MSGKYKYNPLFKFGFQKESSSSSSGTFVLINKTTSEIFSIANPQKGETYFNPDEDKIVYYSANGWRMLDGDSPLQYIVYSNDFYFGG